VELLEAPTWIYPELVDEHATRIVVDLKGFGLSARSVQREHQLPAKTLAQGVLLDEYLELADELGARSARKLGLDAVFERRQA
jgi:hypothetical protein